MDPEESVFGNVYPMSGQADAEALRRWRLGLEDMCRRGRSLQPKCPERRWRWTEADKIAADYV